MILCVKSFPLPVYLAAVYLMYLVGENNHFYRLSVELLLIPSEDL